MAPTMMPRTQAWLNGSERDRLRLLETMIERGARAFVDMGRALVEIRDSKLYRQSHANFDSYCKERWGLSRSRCYELMAAAGVAEQLSGNPDKPGPVRAAAATELVPLRDDPEAMREVWDEAVEKHGPTPTAEQVREIRSPTPVKVSPAPSSKDTRFELIEDAVSLLRLLPDPDAIAFPADPGDAEVVGEALGWLTVWLPQANAAWRRHKTAQRRPRAVA